MKRTKRMDPYLLSRQKWELQYVVEKLRKEGFKKLEVRDILIALKAVGRSRRKVYNYLRKNY